MRDIDIRRHSTIREASNTVYLNKYFSIPIMSLPERTTGMACAWIAVGASNPARTISRSSSWSNAQISRKLLTGLGALPSTWSRLNENQWNGNKFNDELSKFYLNFDFFSQFSHFFAWESRNIGVFRVKVLLECRIFLLWVINWRQRSNRFLVF